MKLHGYFAVFNEWAEINSRFEGQFLERVAPGAFKRTIAEDRDQVRVLLEHGADPQVGLKPLGPVARLEEETRGVAYEVSLLDTGYVRELIPAFESGQYGSSFRFMSRREEFVMRPGKSTHNPDGVPERTLLDLHLWEFGPVMFPAYKGATAGVRAGMAAPPRADVVAIDPALLEHRREVVEPGLGSGPVPLTMRALRLAAATRSDARQLVNALERGGRVEVTWASGFNRHVFSRGRLLGGGSSVPPCVGAGGWTATGRGRPGSSRMGAGTSSLLDLWMPYAETRRTHGRPPKQTAEVRP